MLKKCIFVLIFSLVFWTMWAQNEQSPNNQTQKILYTERQMRLKISAENLRLVADEKGGFHLYVKKLANINSIILTETTKDPDGKQDSYAYRAKEYNSINGDEIRLLDGKKLDSEVAKYSLVDSTPEETSFFGPAFHIYIPKTIVYGYEWSRHGEITIGRGTFINIRSFEKPYADYSGDYMDSPFMFDLKITKKPVQQPAKPSVTKPAVTERVVTKPAVKEEKLEDIVEPETILTDDYNPIAGEKFKEISDDIIYSKGPATIIEDISQILKDADTEQGLDVVLAIDATGSMKDDIGKLKEELAGRLETIFGQNSQDNNQTKNLADSHNNNRVRIGLLFYRDYGDTFKYMNLPVKVFQFTSNFNTFAKNLNSIRIMGSEGGDVPEAVYEAMYAAAKFYDWRSEAHKQIILIGDAQPHPTPRGTGKYSKEYVMNVAEEKGVKIKAILLPKN